MAKHCTNCGHDLRDTDKFCSECGTAASGGATPQPTAVQWEYCEIDYGVVTREGWITPGEYQWYAMAVHPARGRYLVREVRYEQPATLGKPDDAKERQALDALIAGLTADGWELLPNRGKAEYSYKFRRQVKG